MAFGLSQVAPIGPREERDKERSVAWAISRKKLFDPLLLVANGKGLEVVMGTRARFTARSWLAYRAGADAGTRAARRLPFRRSLLRAAPSWSKTLLARALTSDANRKKRREAGEEGDEKRLHQLVSK
jgi:hypothetical protein